MCSKPLKCLYREMTSSLLHLYVCVYTGRAAVHGSRCIWFISPSSCMLLKTMMLQQERPALHLCLGGRESHPCPAESTADRSEVKPHARVTQSTQQPGFPSVLESWESHTPPITLHSQPGVNNLEGMTVTGSGLHLQRNRCMGLGTQRDAH